MSIQSEIDRINTAKSAIATAITNKGVAVPSGTKLDGMATLISGIVTGGSGTISITADGTYDVSQYASANVDVVSLGTRSITANGTYDVTKYASATVNVASAPALLWTNASPTSAFAAQTVTLSTGYNGYIVEVLSYYNRTEKCCGFFNVGSGYGAVLAYTGSQIFGRLINSVTANSIQFGGPAMGYYGNNEGIPQRIWGVKFSL